MPRHARAKAAHASAGAVSRVSGPLSRCAEPSVARPWSAIMPDRPRGLLDDLVGGGEQRFGDGKAESFGSLEVEDEFELV